ncbi:MAG: hypothetical protein AAFP08_12205, partial [Bacteroidota bacterium]
MSPLRFCAVRALVLVCFVFCTSAGGKLGAQVNHTFVRDTFYMGEIGLNTLRTATKLQKFENLISESELGEEKIAGFLFVPYFEFQQLDETAIPEGIQWQDATYIYNGRPPAYDLTPSWDPDPRLVNPDVIPSSPPAFRPVISTGLNVFIASWEDIDVSNNERTLNVFGTNFPEFEDILDPTLDTANANGEWFRLETTNATMYSDTAHENNMADAVEFGVTYLNHSPLALAVSSVGSRIS